jgi:hypothetical protein
MYSNLSTTCPETEFQSTVATKPYVDMSHISNQQKAEFVAGVFIYIVSREVMVKFHQTPILYRKV